MVRLASGAKHFQPCPCPCPWSSSCEVVKKGPAGGLPPLQCGLGVPRATSTVAIGLQQLVHAGGPIGSVGASVMGLLL